MLASLVKQEEEKRLTFLNAKINEHIVHAEKMRYVKKTIELLGDGLIDLSMKFEEPTNQNIGNGYLPRISINNIMGCADILNAEFNEKAEIVSIKVAGLGLFQLMGEKHTIESFFKKIAPYLRTIKK
jgi:hypothetical protein